MENDYRAGANWQALNRIWKALSPVARESAKEDFRLLADMVKAGGAAAAPAENEYDFENRYLEGMSKAAKAYALGCLTLHRTDVYAKISECVRAHQIRDMDSLWAQYARENEVSPADEAAVREIMCFCLERARIQGRV